MLDLMSIELISSIPKGMICKMSIWFTIIKVVIHKR